MLLSSSHRNALASIVVEGSSPRTTLRSHLIVNVQSQSQPQPHHQPTKLRHPQFQGPSLQYPKPEHNTKNVTLSSTPQVAKRRSLLLSAGALLLLNPLSKAEAGPQKRGLLPLQVYLSQLAECEAQLRGIADELEACEEGEVLEKAVYQRLRDTLHRGALGSFWVTARGCDRYMTKSSFGTERSNFAREKEDIWKLLPDKLGVANSLTPNFDNPDDKLCLIYACVNDPSAPASIDTLYQLKLLDEGMRIGAKGGVATPQGLGYNVEDCINKIRAYTELVEAAADASIVDPDWINPAPAGWSGVGI